MIFYNVLWFFYFLNKASPFPVNCIDNGILGWQFFFSISRTICYFLWLPRFLRGNRQSCDFSPSSEVWFLCLLPSFLLALYSDLSWYRFLCVVPVWTSLVDPGGLCFLPSVITSRTSSTFILLFSFQNLPRMSLLPWSHGSLRTSSFHFHHPNWVIPKSHLYLRIPSLSQFCSWDLPIS